MRRKGRSPTQRTLAELRDQGLIAELVERRSPARPGMPFGQTHDFLGCIDIIAISPTETRGVQSCGQDFAAHYRKMVEERAHEVREWLRGPGRTLELWGWRKVKARLEGGGFSKALVWAPRIHRFSFDDLREDV